MASKKELKALITLAGKIDPSLQASMMKASKLSTKVANDTKKSTSALSKVATVAKGVLIGNLAAKAVGKLGSAMIETGQRGIQLASNLSEVQNVVDTTFRNDANRINEWSKTALKSFGLSELQAKQYSSTLGAMMKSSGVTGDNLVLMSQKLSGLSGEFASFYNVAQDDAFGDIQSAMAGQTETMLKYGINMNVANLQAYALSKGIKTSWENMDQAAKTTLRYSYIMEKSKDAQGDFAKTQGSFANQTRLLKTNFDQLSAQLMSKALPYLTQWLQKGNELISKVNIATVIDKGTKAFNEISDGVKIASEMFDRFSPIIAGATAGLVFYKGASLAVTAAQKLAIISTLGSIAAQEIHNGILLISAIRTGGLAAGTIALEAAQGSATIAQWALNAAMNANPIALVTMAIAGLVAGGVLLYKNWDTISSKAGQLWESIKSTFASGVNWTVDKLNGLIKGINKIPGIEIPLIPLIQKASDTGSSDFAGGHTAMAMYADGGIATRASIFGEAGPEMAIPLERTPRSLGLLSRTAKILGVDGSGQMPNITINVNVSASSNEPSSIANAAKEAVENTVLEILEKYFSGEERVSFG